MTIPDAYPDYADPEREWTWGLPASSGGTYRGGTSGVNGTWQVFLTRMYLEPGEYTWTHMKIFVGFMNAANATPIKVAMYDASGDTDPVSSAFSEMGGTIRDISDEQPAGQGSSLYEVTFDTPITFTVEAGKSYCWGLMAKKAVATAGRPGVKTQNDAQGNEGMFYGAAGTGALPDTTLGTLLDWEQMIGYITLTTANRHLTDRTLTYTTGTVYQEIPNPGSFNTQILLRDVVAASGAALTIDLCSDSAGNISVLGTAVLRFDGTGDLMQWGATGSIEDLAIGAGEDGDEFDIVINPKSGGTTGLLFANTEAGQGVSATDIVAIHHTAKRTDSRDRSGFPCPTIAAPYYIRLTSAGTVELGSIEVGTDMLVMLADSQGSVVNSRLGAQLPGSFTYPRMIWDSSIISGSRLASEAPGSSTAAYLRYCNTTIGDGDLCELDGVEMLISGIGVNDIGTVSDQVERDSVPADMVQRVSQIVSDVYARSNLIYLLGLPPWSAGGVTEDQAQAIRQYNAGLCGLAYATRSSYYDPWFDMVEPGTEDDPEPTFDSTYTNEGLHYNATGATAVSESWVAIIEAGRVSDDPVTLIEQFIFPVVGDVRLSIEYGFGSDLTGNLELPLVGKVIDDTSYGTNGSELTGTYASAIASQYLAPETYGEDGTELTGGNVLAGVNDVRTAVGYGPGGAVTGVYVPAIEAKVAQGFQYGANASEFTGSLGTGGAFDTQIELVPLQEDFS